MRARQTRISAALWIVLVWSVFGQTSDPSDQPAFDTRESPHLYRGPGRELGEPLGLEEIRIGYFGPSEDSVNGDLWKAARMAVEELNEAGGYRSKSYRLVKAWSVNPWGSGVAQVARMVYDDKIWALVGGIDGPSTHLAEQVVVKARLPLISPGSSDRTANLAHVPWIFSCLPGEDRQAQVLLPPLLRRKETGGIVLVSATDHDSRVFTEELRKLLSNAGLSVWYHLNVEPGHARRLSWPGDLDPARAGTFVIVAGALDSAELLQQVRRVFQGLVLGSAALGRRAFLQSYKADPGPIFFPYPADPQGVSRFSELFRQRYGHPTDFVAAQTYDAVWLLVEAMTGAGLNRARIADSLRSLVPWKGLAGPIEWDTTGQNIRAVHLATIRQGQIVVTG